MRHPKLGTSVVVVVPSHLVVPALRMDDAMAGERDGVGLTEMGSNEMGVAS